MLTHKAHYAHNTHMEQQAKLAFAYLRVSGKGQVDGDGFPRQLAAIEAYAKANGLTLVKVFREQGISGTKELENRPALQALLGAVDSHNVPVVLIEKLDRLARDLMIQETILRDLLLRGVSVISTMEPDLCNDDPSRKLVRQVMGAIAEYERVMIVAKLAGARQRMRVRTGSCEGRKPYGERKGERRTIDRILALRAAGMAMDAIAETLDAEGLKPRSGQRWYGSSVRNVLLRAKAVTA
jgi:DNA invertase Pin-like site-specific DNA recombinase